MRIRLVAGLVGAAVALAIVALTSGIGSGGDAAPEPRVAAQTEAGSGLAVFARMGCGSCHTFAAAGSQGQIGPDLDQRLSMHNRSSLIAKITTPPSANGMDFSVMPQNFGSRMDAKELDSLVDFLLATRKG
jgi:mono/diheme cytochrome c family protein